MPEAAVPVEITDVADPALFCPLVSSPSIVAPSSCADAGRVEAVPAVQAESRNTAMSKTDPNQNFVFFMLISFDYLIELLFCCSLLIVQ
jgi:hypothetical protein